MRGLLIFTLVFVPVFAIAQETETATQTADNAGMFGFFSFASGWFEDVYTAIAVDAPSSIQRLFAALIEWCAVAYLYAKVEAITFAWGVAKVILEDLAFGSTLNSLMSGLPQDVRAFIGVIRLPECIEILAGAHVTRFVMGLI